MALGGQRGRGDPPATWRRTAGAVLIAVFAAGCGAKGGADALATVPPPADGGAAAVETESAPASSAPDAPAGGSDLVLAARFGQESTVRLLLDRGVDVNSRDALGRTALITAAAEPGSGVMRLLLERGADLALRDRDGIDALMAAVMKGRMQNVRLLLDAGAALDARSPAGETALMAAIRAGQSEMVDFLLSRGADPNVYTQDEINAHAAYTPLMYAARYGRGQEGLHMLRQLMRRGATPGIHRPNGETALTLAQRNGQQEMVRDLRSLGVRDESPYAGLSAGDALLQAIRLDDFAKVQELLKGGANANYRNLVTGVTPVASAAYHGRRAVLELLIRHGASVDDVPWGLREERIAVSSVPLAQRDLMRAMARGDTALISAVRRSDLPMVELLLDAGAGVMVPNREGETPGLLAARAGEARIVGLLLRHGLDPDAKSFPMRVSYLLTRLAQGEELPPLLIEAARHGHGEVVATLLRAGASAGIRDQDGRTALHRAAADGHADIVRQLLKHEAGVDVRDRAGTTALMAAARGGHAAVVRMLLAAGAGMNFVDEAVAQGNGSAQGMSALIYAVDGGHTEVIRLLLQHGAQANLRSSRGENALELARRTGNEEAVALLSGRID